ncbi:hypothetical protein ACFQX7_31055 [Luedemannella flava]
MARGAARAETGATLSVHDALTVTDLLEHWLRPLLQPVLPVRSRALTNGLACAGGLAAKWRHGIRCCSPSGIYLRGTSASTRPMAGRASCCC